MWKQKLHIVEDPVAPAHARELTVCSNAIQRIRKSLELFEQKHHKTTEEFLEEVRSGSVPDNPGLKDDYDAWKSSCDSLQQWQELENRLREAQEFPAEPDRKRE